MRGYTQDKDAYLRRVHRIEGQVRGIARMVEEDVYCIDVSDQPWSPKPHLGAGSA